MTVIATHVMNTYDGYERKMRTYEGLSDLATGAERLVIGMDGNNWYDWIGSGSPPVIAPCPENHAATALFHGRDPVHGLRDTLRVAIERDPSRRHAGVEHLDRWGVLAATHRRVNALDRMDRIYASADLTVMEAGVDGTSFGPSDHALVWADLCVGADVPPEPSIVVEPRVDPKPRRRSREGPTRPRNMEQLVERLVLDERYGWNRRGYFARVAIASASRGFADRAFIEDHYPWTDRPAKVWSPTRNTINRSWRSLGGPELRRGVEELISYDPRTRRHSMPELIAVEIVDALGIADLVDGLAAIDLEEQLRARFDVLIESEPEH